MHQMRLSVHATVSSSPVTLHRPSVLVHSLERRLLRRRGRHAVPQQTRPLHPLLMWSLGISSCAGVQTYQFGYAAVEAHRVCTSMMHVRVIYLVHLLIPQAHRVDMA